MCRSVTLGIDGATIALSKSMSNVILHTPLPFFLEYLRADLKRETAVNLLAKLEDVVKRLEDTLVQAGFSVGKWGSSSHLSFISDSCNAMRCLRSKLEDKGVCVFAFGCSAHSLNNLCQDICELPRFKTFIKQVVLLAKTFKTVGMIQNIFASFCVEKFGKV